MNFVIAELFALVLLIAVVWIVHRLAQSGYQNARKEVHGLRNDLNAAHLKIELLTAEKAALEEKKTGVH